MQGIRRGDHVRSGHVDPVAKPAAPERTRSDFSLGEQLEGLPQKLARKPDEGAPLSAVSRVFRRPLGEQDNIVVVDPRASAQIVVENYEPDARKRSLLVTQQAGNLGGGLWWRSDTVTGLRAPHDPQVVHDGEFRGVRVAVVADADGPLTFERPLLDSNRSLRDRASLDVDEREAVRQRAFEQGLVEAEAVRARPIEVSPGRIVFERVSLSGTHTHRMVLEALAGTTLRLGDDGGVTAQAEGRAAVAVTYVTNVRPLTPIAPLDFLAPAVRKRFERDLALEAQGALHGEDAINLRNAKRALEELSSMVFREKALAGGWRFFTYFGRDTLLTAQMLRPLLDPSIVRGVLQAALERTAANGEVAHEEDLLDQAEHVRLTRALEDGTPFAKRDAAAPIYDYKMIDDDFILTSVAADVLLDPQQPASERDAFLDAVNASGRTNRECLERSLAYMAEQARPYAEAVERGAPAAERAQLLIRFKPGLQVGDWRDSNAGNGGGVFPGSVNSELVGTTLAKAARLSSALGRTGEPSAARLAGLAQAWESAREHYTVRVPEDELRDDVRTYLRERCDAETAAYWRTLDLGGGVTLDDFLNGAAAPTLRDGLRFQAVSLLPSGEQVRSINFDASFGLIGSGPRPQAVRELVDLTSTPFAIGLGTAVGVVISNPVFAKNPELFELLGEGLYHGIVVWPWQMAQAVIALQYQARELEAAGDLELARDARRAARDILAMARGAGDLQAAELYSIRVEAGARGLTLRAEPIKLASHESFDAKANGVQLWSVALPIATWAARHGL